MSSMQNSFELLAAWNESTAKQLVSEEIASDRVINKTAKIFDARIEFVDAIVY
jgi:hypothetical protein